MAGVEWSELERVLLQRRGWRRIGSELKGPCPLCGGRDRCWARPGDTASVLLTVPRVRCTLRRVARRCQ